MLGIPHPYLTEGIRGLGGIIKEKPEDFAVEEVPLYHACGEGEHTYFEVEKTNLSTLEAVDRLSRELGRDFREFGFAGLKDRRGITRQVLSVADCPPDRVDSLELGRLRVLWARRHTNKLRVGHLRGNRFHVRIRETNPQARASAEPILDVIGEKGLPNYFGPQRFGSRGDAQWVGRALLSWNDEGAVRRILGCPSPVEGNPGVVAARYLFLQYRWQEALETFPRNYSEERKVLRYLLRHGENYRGARRQIRPDVLKLFFTAYQSYIFNRGLDRRLRLSDGELGRFYPGDVAFVHRNGALFRIDDPETLKERAQSFEISPSGPIFGKKTLICEDGPQRAIDERLLEDENLSQRDFHKLQQWARLEGGRRAFRIPVEKLEWRFEGDDMVLKFFLPKGSFATTLLRELMKNDHAAPGFFARDR